MGYEHYDGEIDGAPVFMSVPVEMLADFGRIAVVSGRIEEVAYHLAGLLGLPQGSRTKPFGEQCKAIRRAVEGSSVSPTALRLRQGGWVADVIAWAQDAPQALDRSRNEVFHRNYVSGRFNSPDWQLGFTRDRLDQSSFEFVDPSMLIVALDDLMRIDSAGYKVFLELLPYRPKLEAERSSPN